MEEGVCWNTGQKPASAQIDLDKSKFLKLGSIGPDTPGSSWAWEEKQRLERQIGPGIWFDAEATGHKEAILQLLLIPDGETYMVSD